MDDAPDDPAPLAEAWQVQQQFSTHMTGGQFALAAAMGERLLELKEAELGPSHPDLATLRGIIAEAYLQMSVHDRAQQLLEQALAGHETAHGPTSPFHFIGRSRDDDLAIETERVKPLGWGEPLPQRLQGPTVGSSLLPLQRGGGAAAPVSNSKHFVTGSGA